ncbi:MAG: hypothetical protein K1X75_05580 [Leptospirales bacterium]|nr:hypothetical protein [Leptospirales bacterium]
MSPGIQARRPLRTSVALLADSGLAALAIESSKPGLVALGWTYGLMALMIWGIDMFLRPDTHLVALNQRYASSELQAEILLRTDGMAEFQFESPENFACYHTRSCAWRYAITDDGYVLLAQPEAIRYGSGSGYLQLQPGGALRWTDDNGAFFAFLPE